jgi:pimeloyl-ACP methyl ester carboxylesterase
MPELSFDRNLIHYVDQGDGVPVVLVHASAPIGHALWSKTAELLGDGYRQVMPDLLGFGKSDDWTEGTSLGQETQGALLTALIEEVLDEPAHLVGHSYGGASAIAAALQAPRLIGSLTLIEPMLMPLLRNGTDDALFNAYHNMAETFLEHAKAGREDLAWRGFVEYWNGPDAWEKMSEKGRASLLTMTKSAIAIFPGNINNPTTTADLATISIPTQVVCGEKTEARNRRVAEIVRDAIPNCRFSEITGAGHMSVLSHPAEIAETVRRHIDTTQRSISA